jgi:TRAP-type C4-dicarboxylate transport system permease large subunit
LPVRALIEKNIQSPLKEGILRFLDAIPSLFLIILMIINPVLLMVGTFMDMTPAVLIFSSIFLPVVMQLGVNPINFGIIMVFNLSIGLCTPPVGSVLFIGCGIAGTSIAQIIRPFLSLSITMLVSLPFFTFIPEISLFPPRLFGY